MTTQINSAFGECSLSLDSDFREFEQLSKQIETLELQSDHGFDRGQQLLGKLDACGKRIGDGMQILASTLEEQRKKTEDISGVIAERVTKIQERQQQTDRMTEKLRALGEVARQVTAVVMQVRKTNDASTLPRDEQASLNEYAPEILGQLDVLLDETLKIRDEARAWNMKFVEKTATTLHHGLQTARHRLHDVNEKLNTASAAH